MERMDTNEPDDFLSKSEALLIWLKQNDATISSKIQLADLRAQNAGRGVVATEDLVEDEELFRIPRSLIFTVETTTVPANVQKDFLQVGDNPWFSLIIMMVLEYLRLAESRWKPYFDVLPSEFDTLIYWKNVELDYLEGSTVLDKIGKTDADAMFREELIPKIQKAAASLKLTAPCQSDELLALCHRMGSTIMAYAFDMDSTSDQPKDGDDGWVEDDEEHATLPKCMIPLADMLNADANLNNAVLFYADDMVVMKTIAPVKSGEELYNDFGSLPRADLLRRYGYVTPRYAQYDVVEVSSDVISELAKQQLKLPPKDLEERCLYLEAHGVYDDGYDICRVVNEEGQFSEELRIFINTLAATRAEFERLKSSDKLPKADLSNEAKNFLRAVVVHRYAKYRSMADPPPDISADLNEHRFGMAMQVIEGEKQVLREAAAALSNISKEQKKRPADTLEDEANAIRHPGKK